MAEVNTNIPDKHSFGAPQAYASDNGHGLLTTCGGYCYRPFTKHSFGVEFDAAHMRGISRVEVKLAGATGHVVFDTGHRQALPDTRHPGLLYHEPKRFYLDAVAYKPPSGGVITPVGDASLQSFGLAETPGTEEVNVDITLVIVGTGGSVSSS